MEDARDLASEPQVPIARQRRSVRVEGQPETLIRRILSSGSHLRGVGLPVALACVHFLLPKLEPMKLEEPT